MYIKIELLYTPTIELIDFSKEKNIFILKVIIF